MSHESGRGSLPGRLLALLERAGLDLRPVLSRGRGAALRPVRDDPRAVSGPSRQELHDEVRAIASRLRDEVARRQELIPAPRTDVDERAGRDGAGRSDAPAHLQPVDPSLALTSSQLEASAADLVERLGREQDERRSQLATLEGIVAALDAPRDPALATFLAGAPTPVVSVIMPTRNRAELVGDAIASVRSQRLESWELIIVDDGSSDGTPEAVAPHLKDPRIRYVSQPARGVGAARNHGLRLARGPLVAYLDSDNVWYPGFLEGAVTAFAVDGRTAIVYGVLVTQSHGLEGTQILWNRFDREKLLRSNFVDLNVVVHRRSLVEEHGGFDETLDRLVDWDLILRYAEHVSPLPVPVLGARYRALDDIRITDTRPIGPNYLAILRKRRAATLPERSPRVLYTVRRYPHPDGSPLETEIRCMRRLGVQVDVWRQTAAGPDRPASGAVHDDPLADTIRRTRPDVVHVHGLRLAIDLALRLDELAVPVTIRADGFEKDVGAVDRLLDIRAVRRIFVFPHQRRGPGTGDDRLCAVPVAFDTASLGPVPGKDRLLVVSTGAASPHEDPAFFLELARQLPGHRCVLAIPRDGLGSAEGDRLRNLGRQTGSPAEVTADLERADFLSLVGSARIYLVTARPRDPGGPAPLGTLSGIVDAMATGCHVLVPDHPDLSGFPGKAGAVYRDAAHAAEIIGATSAWTVPDWARSEIAAIDHAYLTHADEIALQPLLDAWRPHMGTEPSG